MKEAARVEEAAEATAVGPTAAKKVASWAAAKAAEAKVHRRQPRERRRVRRE